MLVEAPPIGNIVFKDLTMPDSVAIVISFKEIPKEHHWPQIHRDLQKHWKCNFPYFWRRPCVHGNDPHCYGFFGIKQYKTKGVRREGVRRP